MADLQVDWKRGYRKANELDPQKVYRELEKLRTKNNGELNNEDIVEAAKSNRSPMHKGFTWDDTECGRLHRLREAGLMVRCITVVRPESPETGNVRAYEVSRAKSRPKNTYRSIDDIMDDPELRGELLNRALGELLAVRRRYSQLQELAIVFRALDEVLETAKP